MKNIAAYTFLLLLVPLICSADIFVGNYNDQTITVYSNTANGNIAPLRTITGGSTGLGTIESVFVDEVNSEIFAANSDLHTITVYALLAQGDAAPIRTISGPGLNEPGGIFVDAVNNELFVANYGNDTITVYSRTADGAATPLRTISGVLTGLDSNGPYKLFVDLVHNELFVGNYSNNSITVHSRTADSNAPYLRRIIGPSTGINHIAGLFVDTTNNEIFASNYSADTITVYGRLANGDATPIRTISGLVDPGGIYVDTINNEVLVSNYGSLSVDVYNRTAQGSPSPLRTISGASTGLTSPWTLYVTAPTREAIPTMTEWGMVIFMLLAGLSAVCYLRRQRKAEK